MNPALIAATTMLVQQAARNGDWSPSDPPKKDENKKRIHTGRTTGRRRNRRHGRRRGTGDNDRIATPTVPEVSKSPHKTSHLLLLFLAACLFLAVMMIIATR